MIQKEFKQKAIESCVTAFLLDMTRLFKRVVSIDNVGDKRFWESELKHNEKQFTNSSSDIKVEFANNIRVETSQNTAPTNIKYSYVNEENAVSHISIKSKRKTLKLTFNCRIEADNFVESMSVTEELIDKTSNTRTFAYQIFGKMFNATYRIQNDISPDSSKQNFDYSNTDNGFFSNFTIELEMHYYSIMHSSAMNVSLKVIKVCKDVEIETGKQITVGGKEVPEIITVKQCENVLSHDSAEIIDADHEIIREAFVNVVLKSSNSNLS